MMMFHFNIKSLALLSLTAALSIGSASAASLVVDGAAVPSDVAPVVVNGRTLVPVRALFESLGATVGWEESTQTATATKGSTVISMQIGNTTAYVNGVAKTLDVPAQTIEGRTMAPARFVAESLNATVNWDSASDTVKISTSGATSAQTTPSNTQTSTSTTTSTQSSTNKTVYVTKTGKRYHYDNNCNGGTYYPSTLSEAQSRGLTPCNKCVQ